MPGLYVERRKGRFYLYSRRRVNGRLTAQYLGPVTESEAAVLRRPAGPTPAGLARADAAAVDRAAGAVLAAAADFDGLADRVFRAAMHAGGFRLHRRSEWRRKRRTIPMKLELDEAGEFDDPGESAPRPGLIRPASPDPKEQAVLERARAGDKVAIPAVQGIMDANPKRVEAWGAVSSFARLKLVREAAGDDLTLAHCITRTVEDYHRKLVADAGPDPTYAERLTAHRVVNNWLAVHVLECRLTDYTEASPAAAALERRLSQAERRLHASLKALATLRRLRGPLPTQVNVATTGNVLVNAAGGRAPALPGGGCGGTE